jgi:hypothetical protein
MILRSPGRRPGAQRARTSRRADVKLEQLAGRRLARWGRRAVRFVPFVVGHRPILTRVVAGAVTFSLLLNPRRYARIVTPLLCSPQKRRSRFSDRVSSQTFDDHTAGTGET